MAPIWIFHLVLYHVAVLHFVGLQIYFPFIQSILWLALLLASPRGVVASESDCDFVCSLAISEEAEQAGKSVL